jgi:phosphoribosylformylglycinamidine (FGAM) synthase-like enzyme
VEVSEKQAGKFESITKGIPCAVVGKVIGARRFVVYGLDGEIVVDADLDELLNVWKHGLEAET